MKLNRRRRIANRFTFRLGWPCLTHKTTLQMGSIKISKMSFTEIFNDISKKLGDVKDISKKFSDLKSDDDRFKLTQNICEDFISAINFKRINKSDQVLCLLKLGDTNFSESRYLEALNAYNEAIAFASAGSEHMGLIFLKRSMALSKLLFVEEALNDCVNALALAKTDRLKAEIIAHKETIVKQKVNSDDVCLRGNGKVFTLSGGESSFFDSASDSVELHNNNLWGRQLVAKNDIGIGDVLVMEKPYSSVLFLDHVYTHCSHCFKRGLNLKPCSGCSFAMFCSETCQKDSEQYHNIECKIIDILFSLKLQIMELLSLRIIIVASQQGKNLHDLYEKVKEHNYVRNNENKCTYKSGDFLNMYDLVTNSEKRAVSDLFHRSVVSMVLINLLEKYTNFFNWIGKKENKKLLKAFCGGLILRFMQSLPCNAHEISELCDEGLEEIGGGAYATLSLINHSCDPNVVRYSCGDAVVLRAIRPIKKGDQILDNYGYHYATHSITERQAALMKQYYFKCECEACTQLWPTFEHLPSENVQFKGNNNNNNKQWYEKETEKFEENLKKILNGDFNPNNEVMNWENIEYLNFLDKYVERPWQNYNKCQEAIKHIFFFTGNHFRFSKKVLG